MTVEQDWEEFKAKLKKKTEIDLDLYKAPQMQRRILNLAKRHGYETYSGYFDKVVQDKDDFAAFIEYLTINVSEFFRTPDKFAKLETDVIPDLLTRSSKLNIWSAGCSIGAEPYSLAMIMKTLTPNTRHRILATDLDIEILAKARRGEYSINELKAMDENRKKKYFTVTGDTYAVTQEIKDCIEFKRHNLLKDDFEQGFDLILCRNVVIYFTEEAKDQLYANFFKALKPGGILFVGATEAILNFRKLGYTSFQPFFYQKPLV
ncbi:MAG: protein-glutamate O-methyltransferase CheR [Anaerovibrio sp.]|uniref:CheR family methyltransferase n=1 Tax=Anaerovibrio sp. TaxID=1872532 RepID=UPI0025E0490D|nr:protein-glutamate O-methyltransferase CheR [Anaerovibrio sp.]MCR5177041.1 protein-glutamate O-methyltransferase CheR [Anaerovibrio sp.]